mgnify:CR=1 FL=1
MFFTIVFTMVVDEAGALGLASPGDAFSISLPYAFVGAPNLTSVVADHLDVLRLHLDQLRSHNDQNRRRLRWWASPKRI